MLYGTDLWAMATGAVVLFNPCGIVLLPASLAWLAGFGPVKTSPVRRAAVGALSAAGMAAGFVLVVVLLATVLKVTGLVLGTIIKPVSIVLAVALMGSGLLVALGRFHLPMERWVSGPELVSSRLPWLRAIGAGLAYAVGALSCTLPLFIAVLLPALSVDWIRFAGLALSFGVGVFLVLLVLSEAALFGRDAITSWIGNAVPLLPKVFGTIIFVTGVGFLYYWVWGPGRWL